MKTQIEKFDKIGKENTEVKKTEVYKTFRVGSVNIAVFKNENDYLSFVVQKGYKDDKGEWKNTNSFNESDLVVLSSLLRKVVSDLII